MVPEMLSLVRMKRSITSWHKLMWAGLIVVGLSVAGVLVVHWLGGPYQLRAWVLTAGVWAPVAFVAAKAATNVAAPVSGSALVVSAGALFGLWPGVLLVTIGDVLGQCINFWIARLVGRPGIRRLAGLEATRRVDHVTDRVGGWKALLVAAVFGSSIYDFVSYAAGLSKLPFWQFFWVTLVGGVPTAILFVAAGDWLVGR